MTDKQQRIGASFVLLLTIVLLGLAYFFNFYPGGYSYADSQRNVLIEKGIFKKESSSFVLANDTELKIAILKNNITQLKSIWYIFILTTATFLFTALNLLNNKRRVLFTACVVVLIVVLILLFKTYLGDLNNIENIIANLKK